jgi:type II secretory pathway component PulJ
VQAAELDRQARIRRFVLALLRDLRRLGFTDDQLRGRTVFELEQMKHRATRELMGPPGSPKAA